MKLLSIRMAFIPREKLGMLNLTLGGRIPVRSMEGIMNLTSCLN